MPSKKNKEKVGRPKIDEDQPNLHETNLDLMQASSATDDRRRSEIMKTVTTLSDLQSELISGGFTCSKRPTYCRLLPRGKRAQIG